MSNPIILWDSIFTKNRTLSGIALTGLYADSEDADYPVDFLADAKNYTRWKAGVAGAETHFIYQDLNKVENAGFEQAIGANDWTDRLLAPFTGRSSADKNSGTYSGITVATGSTSYGPYTRRMQIDPNKTYKVSLYYRVTARSAGSFLVYVLFFSDVAGVKQMSVTGTNLVTDASTGAWTNVTKTMGAGLDIEIPVGARSCKIYTVWVTSPTGTAYIDDVQLYENVTVDTWGLVGHNLPRWDSTLSLKSTDHDLTDLAGASWTTLYSSTTIDSNKATMKAVTTPTTGHRVFQIQLVGDTYNLVPYVGQLLAGQRITFPNPPQAPTMFKDEQSQLSSARARKGNRLQVIRHYTELVLKGTIPFISEATFASDLETFWNYHGQEGLPFLFGWDLTNEPTEVYWAWFKDNYKFQKPMSAGGYVDQFKFDLLAVKE